MAELTTKVIYNSKRLIPAPFVEVQKQYQRTADQTVIGSVFTLTLTGTIVAFMGSPNSARVFWDQPGYPPDEVISDISRLKSIIRKQEAIRELFSNDGYTFEIQSADGSQPMKCNPRVVSIQFQEGLWYDRCEYVITLECDVLSVNGTLLGEDEFDNFISDASESWEFASDDTPEGVGLPLTYRLTHTVSATGKRFYDEDADLVKPAWEQAQDFVLGRLGYSPTVASNSGVNNLPSYYGGYNWLRSSQQDEFAGTYSVTESFILASGSALEEFTVNTKSDQSTGLVSVSIEGNITGLEERDSSLQLLTSKYSNANTKWGQIEGALLGRAQSYSGLSLNPFPLSKLIGRNDVNGTVTYSYEYNTRPTNLFTGATYEDINVTERMQGDLFVTIPVIGRAAGPVGQFLGSKTERSVTLNIELITPPATFGGGSQIELQAAFYNNPRVTQPGVFNTILAAINPSQQYGTAYQFINPPVESYSPVTGRYTYSIEFIFGN